MKTRTKPKPRAARYDYTKRVDPVDDTPEEEMLGLGATDEETIARVMDGRCGALTLGDL
jgi:hypothetical protein